TASLEVMNGGTFETSTGAVQVNQTGSITLNDGTFQANGIFDSAGQITLSGGSMFNGQAHATLDGDTSIDEGSSFIAASGLAVSDNPLQVVDIAVDGSGSQLAVAGFANFRLDSTLSVTGGATASAGGFNFGLVGAGDVIIDVAGVGSMLSADTVVLGGLYDGISLLSGGEADMNVATGAVVEFTDFMAIFAGSNVNLNGGEVGAPDFNVIDDVGFHFNTGNYHVTGDATLDATVSSSLPNGSLGFGLAIEVDGETTFAAPLVIDGGSFTTASLVGGELVQLQTGKLGITGPGGLSIGELGPLAATVNLPLGTRIEVINTLTVDTDGLIALSGGILTAGTVMNNGLIDLAGVSGEIDAGITFNAGLLTGDGRITGGPLSNLAAGRVIVTSGEQLHLTGAGNTNSGRIDLQNGRLQIDGDLTNLANGNIVGRGTLAAEGGLTNEGDLAFSSGVTDVIGDVTNQNTGRVFISGNADVTFWDDVVDTGTAFNVSSGSSVTFFGGAGFSVSGGGDVFFEDDITPGSSPGIETFGGDVFFGALSTLEIEIGGLVPGVEHDRLEIEGVAHLGGTLKVELINLGNGFYEPQLGDSFGFLASQLGAGGMFANLDLPALSPGLEWMLNPGGITIFLNVVAALPGDYNFDGTVDAGDYTFWRDALGQTGNGLPADGDLSGVIDAGDYIVWRNNFGMTAPAALRATSSLAAVPEPSCRGLLLAALAFLRMVRQWSHPIWRLA
ncbi:MAG: beta strand repeat-containing protein, partial [Aeoliella sp.]